MNHIPGNKLFGRDELPAAVAQHSRLDGEPLAQESQSAIGLIFLDKTQDGIEQQQDADDDGFVPLVNHDLQHDGGFEHPGNGRPEFGEEREQRMALFFLHPVLAELAKAVLRLGGCEPGRGSIGAGNNAVLLHCASIIARHRRTDQLLAGRPTL